MALEIFSLSDAAVLINSDSALLRAKSEECKKKLNTVDRTHPVLVRAVLQKIPIGRKPTPEEGFTTAGMQLPE